MLRTTLTSFGADKIVLVPSKKKTGIEEKVYPFLMERLLFKNVHRATYTQSTPEWFVSRRFKITGTTAGLMFKYIAKQENNSPQIETLLDLIGVSWLFRYARSDEEVLMKKSNTELSNILRENNKQHTGNKIDMVERIINENLPVKASTADSRNGTTSSIATLLLKSWFMQPKKGNKAMRIGLQNEPMVRSALPKFVDNATTETDPFESLVIEEFGLLLSREWRRAAFSPDGIALVQRFVEPELEEQDQGRASIVQRPSCGEQRIKVTYLCSLEIKTKVASDCIAREWEISRKVGTYVDIDISDPRNNELFHQAVPEFDFRAQILHGMACARLHGSFYVVASETRIIRVVHVFRRNIRQFSDAYIDALHEAYLQAGLHWIDKGKVPKIDAAAFAAEGKKEGPLSYAVDQHTIQQTLTFCNSLDKMYIEKNLIIPRCHRILPASVALWNKCKGPIDLYSRKHRNNCTTQNKVQAIGSMWLKMLRTAMYNAYQMHIVIQTNNFLQSKSCETWSELHKHQSQVRQTEGGSYKCFIGNLMEEIDVFLSTNGTNATTTNQSIENVNDGSGTGESSAREYRRRESFFSVYELIQRRTTDKSNHSLERIADGSGRNKLVQKRCVWCCTATDVDLNLPHRRQGFKTTFECNICEVPLCKVTRIGNDKSCFEQWHVAKKIKCPCNNHNILSIPLRDISNRRNENDSDNVSILKKRRRKTY